MEINYEFVPEYESSERKMKSDIISYAGKLLEIVEANTLVVGLDNDNRPFVWECKGRLTDALDFRLILTDFFIFLPPWSPGGFFYSLARGSGSGSARGYPRAMLAVLSPVMI